MIVENVLLLAAEAVVYFVVLAGLFRLRGRFGLGVFVAALGAMHFLETYLAAVIYVTFPFGITVSPGSTVLFAGKLAMLLLVYIREDAAAVRQPIYGLLIANFLIVVLVILGRHHPTLVPVAERPADLTLVDDMGGLMVWGTMLLFVDALAMILLYERSARWFGQSVLPRVLLSLALVLTFDQLGFFLALRVFLEAPVEVLYGGWVGKMVAAVAYGLMVTAYLRWFERGAVRSGPPRLADVFDVLTYRERYEALLERTGRDGLTGLLDRGTLDSEGADLVANALRAGRPVSVSMIDVDGFKDINDREGHVVGDEVLRKIAGRLGGRMGAGDRLYRYGGDEFIVLALDGAHGPALLAAERLRHDVATVAESEGWTLSVSIGVATAPDDGADLAGLVRAADRRLYEAKLAGRDRVVGAVRPPQSADLEPRPAMRPR
ncbi:MAG: diguanylate cyclase [Bauldia sp.]